MPRVLGSMMLRPGLQHIGATRDHAAARHIPFVFATADMALIECTAQALRVRVGEAVVTRVAVSTTVTNGGFDADLAVWECDSAAELSYWIGAAGPAALWASGRRLY